LSQLVFIQARRVRENPDFHSDMAAVIKGIAYFLPPGHLPPGQMIAGSLISWMGTARPLVKTLIMFGAVIVMLFGLVWFGLGIASLSSMNISDPSELISFGFLAVLGVATFTGGIFVIRAARKW
jgi:hypothetical protein